MRATRASDAAYMDANGRRLEAAFDKALRAVLKTKPADPVAFLSTVFANNDRTSGPAILSAVDHGSGGIDRSANGTQRDDSARDDLDQSLQEAREQIRLVQQPVLDRCVTRAQGIHSKEPPMIRGNLPLHMRLSRGNMLANGESAEMTEGGATGEGAQTAKETQGDWSCAAWVASNEYLNEIIAQFIMQACECVCRPAFDKVHQAR